MARRVRPAPRPGRPARGDGPRGGGDVVHPSGRPGAARRPRAAQRRRPDQPSVRRGRVQLLARPHGALAPPARRAARAGVPRLVGDASRRRQHERRDARPDEHLPRPRARQLPRHDPRGDDQPGDAPVPRRHVEPARRGERELRARADGAVHARGRPRRLHGDRRAPARARPHRLARGLRRRLGQLALGRGQPLGLHEQDGVRQDRPVQLGGRLRAGADAPAARVVLRPQALELLHPDAAERRDRGGAGEALHGQRAARSARWSRRSSARPTSTRGRGWSSRRSSCPPG